ncbi:MAG TPA: DUF1343 domain-containing protein [Firmicutes bacterium]|nr:DUF1343 domain-containing protein [Bacillota bacterium]
MWPWLEHPKPVQLGIEVARENLPPVMRGQLGLVTNHAGVDSRLQHDIETLSSLPGVQLTALFSPEHGLRGDAQAGDHVQSSVDPQTGLPIYSLYGEINTPTAQMLENLDALIIDLPDAGARYWTYIYTMARCIKACGEHQLPVVVLDRPNPIGGLRVEGNIQQPDFLSSVGLYPLPIRHGFTMGELAAYFNTAYGLHAELTVVPCSGWQRAMLLCDTGLPYVPGSPNTPTLESLLLYPGTCLFEGTTLSEGRGTTKPFEIIGAPWVNGSTWAKALNALHLPGVLFRPAYFKPLFSKHQGKACSGVQIHIGQPHAVEAVMIGVHMIVTLKRLYPEHFDWRPPYRRGGRYFIDLLTGTDQFRRQIDAGVGAEEILTDWEHQSRAFRAKYDALLLY